MNRIDLSGRVAVVTGAGGGLGRAHALALARRGAAVVINDVGAETAETVVGAIRTEGGRAEADRSDIATAAGGAALIERAMDAFGRIDILVNNAGILKDRSAHKIAMEEVEAVLAVHLLGSFHTTLPAYQRMRAQGYGRLIHTSSASGLFGNFGQVNYGAAKAAIVGLSRVLAIEGKDHNVLSNCISPAARTAMTEATFGAEGAHFNPDLVSPLVVYLASDACRTTGEIFSAGGGQVSRIFIGLTEGVFWKDRPIEPEAIEASLDRIMDTGRFIIPRSLEDEWQKFLRLLGLKP